MADHTRVEVASSGGGRSSTLGCLFPDWPFSNGAASPFAAVACPFPARLLSAGGCPFSAAASPFNDCATTSAAIAAVIAAALWSATACASSTSADALDVNAAVPAEPVHEDFKGSSCCG